MKHGSPPVLALDRCAPEPSAEYPLGSGSARIRLGLPAARLARVPPDLTPGDESWAAFVRSDMTKYQHGAAFILDIHQRALSDEKNKSKVVN